MLTNEKCRSGRKRRSHPFFFRTHTHTQRWTRRSIGDIPAMDILWKRVEHNTSANNVISFMARGCVRTLRNKQQQQQKKVINKNPSRNGVAFYSAHVCGFFCANYPYSCTRVCRIVIACERASENANRSPLRLGVSPEWRMTASAVNSGCGHRARLFVPWVFMLIHSTILPSLKIQP